MMDSRHSSGRRHWGVTAIASLLAIGCATSATADQVTSKGTVLRGTITALNSGGVTFETEYGKGSLAIKWTNIEDIATEVQFQVLYGANHEAAGLLRGVTAGRLTVGTTAVDIATIDSGGPIGAAGLSFSDRVR